MDRQALSQKHFSEPLMQVCDTLKRGIEQQDWEAFNPDPIVHYYNSMISGSLPEMVSESLGDDDVQELSREQVQTFGALLFRDMFRNHHGILRPESDGGWVDPLFNAIAKHHDLPAGAFKDNGKPYDTTDPESPWAGSMGALMGLDPEQLVNAQREAIEHIATECGEPEEEEEEYVQGGFLSGAPPWMISSLLHGLILLVLALVTLDPVQMVKNVLTVTPSDDVGEEMEEFTLEAVEPDSMEEEVIEEPVVQPPTMQAVEAIEVDSPDAVLRVATEVPDIVEAIAPMESLTESLTKAVAATTEFSARSTDMKKELLRKYGGSEETESAVSRALEWFARHQLPNGAWSLHHNIACGDKCGNPGDEKGREAFNGATALALLPFLGAGQTHVQGKYKKVVHQGLQFLIANMKPKNQGGLATGDSRDSGGNMYSHGLTSIVLCEAYAMTKDPDLLPYAQASINYIVMAQNSTGGGWRYSPGQAGDTSVVGWMVMALKSGHMGHLVVPPNSVRGASLFLDRVSAEDGVYYGYSAPQKKASTTAVGLLCRMYLGWKKDHPSLIDGVDYLGKTGFNPRDVYYNYYAAQVLRQFGGPNWKSFNDEMSTWLVENQEAKGHASGSWYFPSGHTGGRGGRLAITSFCTMTLEVYYRHLPLYADKAAEDDFPL